MMLLDDFVTGLPSAVFGTFEFEEIYLLEFGSLQLVAVQSHRFAWQSIYSMLPTSYWQEIYTDGTFTVSREVAAWIVSLFYSIEHFEVEINRQTKQSQWQAGLGHNIYEYV